MPGDPPDESCSDCLQCRIAVWLGQQCCCSRQQDSCHVLHTRLLFELHEFLATRLDGFARGAAFLMALRSVELDVQLLKLMQQAIC